MVRPWDVAAGAGGIVLRVGGNVLTPRTTSQVAHATVDALGDAVAKAAQDGLSVTVLPGGVGGHLFLEWARTVGCSDAIMNDIGCSLIDIGAAILADHLARKLGTYGVSCAPRSARTYPDVVALHDLYKVVVSGACIAGATTSDSLALLLGEALGVPVLSVKRTLPFEAISSTSNTSDCTSQVKLRDIADRLMSEDLVERAGHHPPLDTWSLRLLRRPGVSLSITTPTALSRFNETGHLEPVLKVRNE